MDKEKKYGIIRRLDEFGRVVIPKEIRYQLNLAPEDAVEISVQGRCVVVKKCHLIETLESLCKTYLEAFWKSCRTVCLICSTEYVISNKGLDFSKETPLADEIQKYIGKQEIYLYDEHKHISLFGDEKYLVDAIYPIGTKEEPEGAVLLLHFRDSTVQERCCAKLLADMLTQVMINQRSGMLWIP